MKWSMKEVRNSGLTARLAMNADHALVSKNLRRRYKIVRFSICNGCIDAA